MTHDCHAPRPCALPARSPSRKCQAEIDTYINMTVFRAWYNGNGSDIADLTVDRNQGLWLARNTSTMGDPFNGTWAGNVSSRCHLNAETMLRAIKSYFV
jgi:hypothetical protein